MMDRRFCRAIAFGAGLLAALAVVGCLGIGAERQALAAGASSGDLFYNYYVPPGYGGVGAELYLCPRPTPPWVGHTYVTYQPLMPHEFLYKHHRHYVCKNGDAGRTKVRVSWGPPWSAVAQHHHNPSFPPFASGQLLPTKQ